MSGDSGGKARNRSAAAPVLEWAAVRGFLQADPSLIREDGELLGELGLRLHAATVVDFIPPALARRALAQAPETAAARRELEAVARANFIAQAQTHAAVVDLLEARNHADLARRMSEAARLRFSLAAGVIALERPGRTPAGWRELEPGMTDALLGPDGLCRMGEPLHAQALFGDIAEHIQSVALIRMAIWNPARQGVLAFGSPDTDGFSLDMGAELTSFLARVVERTAERWPVF
jgi:uncharacterized protein YigA (DUF484 family)